jgi:hypothetical protein
MASSLPSCSDDMREQLMLECSAMARYALASGMVVPPQLMGIFDKARVESAADVPDMASLTRTHAQFTRLVAPATPRALLLMGDQHGSRLSWLGREGLVRRLMFAAGMSMLAFLVVNLFDLAGITGKDLNGVSGADAVALEVLYLSSAAMGASFTLLMQVSGYIVKRTYDPKYEPTYWIKFLLGIMAGLILVSMVPVHETSGPGLELKHATIALLGGFSTSGVYRIISRLVETIESFFRPSAKDEAAQLEAAARTRASEDASQARISLAGQLVKLQQQAAAGGDVTTGLQQILSSLVLPVEAASSESAEAPPAGTVALPGIPIVAPPTAEAVEPAPAAAASASTRNAPPPGDANEPAAG